MAFNIDKIENDNAEEVEPEVPYKLPDGNVIQVRKFRSRWPI